MKGSGLTHCLQCFQSFITAKWNHHVEKYIHVYSDIVETVEDPTRVPVELHMFEFDWDDPQNLNET